MTGWLLFNPILPFMRFAVPYFNYYGNITPGVPGNISQRYAAERAASVAHANLGPYGWVSNWGGNIQLNTYDPTLPLSTVMSFQRMNYDPTYCPGLDSTLVSSGMPDPVTMQMQLKQDWERGAMKAEKQLLQISYSGTLQKINSFLGELTQLLKTEGLPAAEKGELEKVKQQTEALKKKMEDYAKTSANKDVQTARAEVEAMAGELVTLKDTATKIAEKIAAQQQQENPEETTDPADQTDPTDTADPNNPVSPTDTEDPNLPADPDDPATSPEAVAANAEEAKKQYNETIRPYINETLLKNKHITAEDKKAVLDKAKEFTKAKPEDQPRVLQELVDLIAEVEKRIAAAAQKAAEKANEEAVSICSDIYTAANGSDFGLGETDNEKKIKDTVLKKITADNVIAVLDAWAQGDYNSYTGDSCLLETLFGEFQFNTSGIKKKLTNHLLKCLEEAAKEKGLQKDIMPYVSIIKGEMNCTFWSYEKIYNAFNSIHAILSNIEEEPVQQQEAPAEAQ